MAFNQEEALDLMMASCLAHDLKTDPVWLALIAPPAEGKTSLLDQLPARSLPTPMENVDDGSIVCVDGLTSKTLLSGLRDREKSGLLERMENAILLVKELSTLSTRFRDVQAVFGQLRRIYDGHIEMTWGSGKTTVWDGRITMIFAGVTHPASLDAELGARLLTVRLGETPTDLGRTLGQPITGNPVDIEAILQRDVLQPTEVTQEAWIPLAETLAILRAAICRERGLGVVEAPLIEAPHRLIGQMGGLGAGLATVWGCALGDPRILETMWRIVWSTTPPARLAALRVLMAAPQPLATTMATAQTAKCGRFGLGKARQALEDLCLLEVVDSKTQGSDKQGRPKILLSLTPEWRARLWLLT